jgi:MFS-type transporter involved in bile tolerance (Atg22 family)
MIEIIEKFGIYVYGIVILFGGIWGTNYFPLNWKEKYKFAAFASLFALIFILLEIFVSKTFVSKDVIKYLLTYTVVTSCYELFMKAFFKKIGLIKDEPTV